MAARWEQVVKTKQDARTKLIAPYLAEIIDDSKKSSYDSITNIDDVDTLVSLMATGKLTAYTVVSAYIRRYAL